MLALGRLISANGSNKLAVDRLIGQLRGAYYANRKVLENRALGIQGRLRFWRSIVMGLGGFHGALDPSPAIKS